MASVRSSKKASSAKRVKPSQNEEEDKDSSQDLYAGVFHQYFQAQTARSDAQTDAFVKEGSSILSNASDQIEANMAVYESRLDNVFSRMTRILKDAATDDYGDLAQSYLLLCTQTLANVQQATTQDSQPFNTEKDAFEQHTLQLVAARELELPKVGRQVKKLARHQVESQNETHQVATAAATEYSKLLKRLMRL